MEQNEAVPQDVPCSICGELAGNHGGKRHHFTTKPGDLRVVEREVTQRLAARVPVATDLALRMALIEKGLVTTDDLAQAEAALGELAREAVREILSNG